MTNGYPEYSQTNLVSEPTVITFTIPEINNFYTKILEIEKNCIDEL